MATLTTARPFRPLPDPFPPLSLPIAVTETSCTVAGTLKGAAWCLAALGAALPLVLVTAYAAGAPEGLAAVALNPVGSIQAALGLVLWSAIAWGATRSISSLWRSRTVVVDDRGVVITQLRRSGDVSRAVPMAAYLGLAHVVRTSLSGIHHELVLVGTDAADDVVVRRAERIGALETAAVADALGVAAVPAEALYVRRTLALADRQADAAFEARAAAA